MKNSIIKLILSVFIFSCNNLVAQDSVKMTPIQVIPADSFQHNGSICHAGGSITQSTDPLYVLTNNNRILDRDFLNFINPKSMKAIDVLKGSSSIRKYGSKAINGVIEITFIEDSVFYSVETLLSIYKIPKQITKLPLYIDNKPFPEDKLLLQRSAIKSVDIVSEKDLGIEKKHIEVTMLDKNWNTLPKKKKANKEEIIIR